MPALRASGSSEDSMTLGRARSEQPWQALLHLNSANPNSRGH